MSALKEITLAEVKKHSTAEDLWLVIEDKVYDVTKFQNEHPGGEDTLLECAGRDATKDFIDAGHSSEAREMMIKYCIGELAQADRKKKLPVREILIAVGAAAAGILVVFAFKRLLTARS